MLACAFCAWWVFNSVAPSSEEGDTVPLGAAPNALHSLDLRPERLVLRARKLHYHQIRRALGTLTLG